MCGDGRLVDMKAYVNGRLGGIEAGAYGAYGACGACGACSACSACGASICFLFALSFFTLYILYYVRSVGRTIGTMYELITIATPLYLTYVRRTRKCYYIPLQGVFSFDSFAQRTRHKKPVFCLGPNKYRSVRGVAA